MPRPFLKWVGGKRQLLPELLSCVKKAGEFGRYHEPFVGGGALFFELSRLEKIKRQAYLSDNNRNLIDTYYYEVRAHVPDSLLERAARIIYLNKTCFNGLFRENSKGLFNVPLGKYKNPLICDEVNLRAVATALKKTKIEARPFESVLNRAKPGDLVYFDPPYHPVSKTSSFTAYAKGGFGEDAQQELANVFRELDRAGVHVLLSNSMTDFVKELYHEYRTGIVEVFARRMVNSRADRRGKVAEVLVRNF
jgi:DNA adenine methylase